MKMKIESGSLIVADADSTRYAVEPFKAVAGGSGYKGAAE